MKRGKDQEQKTEIMGIIKELMQMQRELKELADLEDLTPFEESSNFQHNLTLIYTDFDSSERNNKVLFDKFKVFSTFF